MIFFRRWPVWIRENPVLPWGALFLAICLSVTQYGGTNGLARVAAMRAITEGHTLHIDSYKDWTIDWSLSPNGHYYSNKAPGPVFLALPVFAVADVYFRWRDSSHRDEHGRAPAPGYALHLLTIAWLQLLPCFFLVLWISWRLRDKGISPAGIHFFALAVFFGNTAAIYMNSNFGHGVSSLLFLAAFYFWVDRRYHLTGLFLSFSLLSDYGVTFALPFFLLSTAWRERNWKNIFEIGIGAIPAAALWIWYHTVTFGSPFATANQFTNPEQIDVLPGKFSLWGEYSPFPSLFVIGQLLVGTTRGLIVTQPWVFAIFVFPFLRAPRATRGLTLLALGSLCGLLWMNGGFGGWHGGWCAGPRYLSSVIPAMALAIALCWNQLPQWLRPRLWALLAVALVFRLLVYPSSNLAPEEDLWPYYFRRFTESSSYTPHVRLAMGMAFVALAIYWQKRRGLFAGWKSISISRKSV